MNAESPEKQQASNDLSRAIYMNHMEADMNMILFRITKPERIQVDISQEQMEAQKNHRTIKHRLLRKNVEHFGQKNFIEDEFERPVSTRTKLKYQFGKMKDKTKNLWKKLSKCMDFEPELTYEEDEKQDVPPEIKKIQEFIEKRGEKFLQFLQKTGRLSEAKEFKEKIKKALRLKEKLEKISRLDFSKPKRKLLEVAAQFGIDLFNPDVQKELKKMHKEKIHKLKEWVNKVFGNSDIAQKISQDDNVKKDNLYLLKTLYSLSEAVPPTIEQHIEVEPRQVQESVMRQQEEEKPMPFPCNLITTSSYTGKSTIYVYGRCYGLLGLIGILVSILFLGILHNCL